MFNNRITSKAIGYYFAALILVNIVFFSHMMDIIWWLFGSVSVVVFFKGGQFLSRKWENLPEKKFIKRLFYSALIIRIIHVSFMYIFYEYMTGAPFEFGAADSYFYHNAGLVGAEAILGGNRNFIDVIRGEFSWAGMSDLGQPVYMSIIYAISGNSIYFTHLMKALWSAWLVVLVYKIAVRNFGVNVARIASIFALLMPNFYYYNGTHLKETEMIFLTVLFIERADYLIRGKDFTFKAVAPIMLIAVALFMYRTVLGAAALFALFTAVFLTSGRVLKLQKKIILTIWVGITISYFVGGKVANEIQERWEDRSGKQEAMLEFRATREGGNKFATNAGTAVFAPMIFVIPFPTMINIEIQQNQQSLNGGYFVKNIMAFFVILVLFHFIKTGKWKEHLLIIAFTLGYLVIIAMSSFAQSERFHLPALPFLLIFAAYGISIFDWKKHGKYFDWWLLFIFVAIIGWSWFKLAGRGLA